MRIGLLIQYDGNNYHGWQIQTDPQTVQGALERALNKVFENPSGLVGSGRTDSGVHALGQVAHFDIADTPIPYHNLWKAVNRHLPDDIRVIASQNVPEEFHSRFAAKKREYRYEIMTNQNVLHRNDQWYIRFPLEIDKLHELSRVILGSHNFSSFCYAGTETQNMICNISDASWIADIDGRLKFMVGADRFLHHMVRMLIGSMIEVARGKWRVDRFTALLENPDRKAQAVTAPARGLALIKVSYPDDFQLDWDKTGQYLAT